MLKQTQAAPLEAAEMLGDFHPLMEQLGSVEGLVTLAGAAGSLQMREIDGVPALRAFIRDYHARILAPIELPAIQHACLHAARNEVRELVVLDAQLAAEPVLQNFRDASRRVGRAQLQKLRPLCDERVVRRYLAAVDEGRAQGWHTLVYGLTLAVYSLPLRQGLSGYAHQATRGFIHAAARGLRLSGEESRHLLKELTAGLPAAVEALLGPVVVV